MTEKKPGEPDDPVLAKRYAALDDYGKKLVHEIGALVLDAHAAGKREGAREALDAIKIHGVPLIQQLAGSAAAVASEMNCFSEKERCSEDDRCEYHTVQEELSRNFSHIFELAIRALADQPEAEKDAPDRYVECPGCSRAGGAERAIYHEPPVCAESPQAPAKVLPPCDSNASKAEILYNHELRLVQLEENAFGGPAHPNPPARVMPLEAKADALPLDHPFQPCPTPGHCEDYGERFCHRPFCSAPEAAHGRK